jgi:hypothetical protein
MHVDGVTQLCQRGHYVNTIAKSFNGDSAFRNGGIRDRRAFALHTHSDRVFLGKNSVCPLFRVSGVLGQLVPIFRCAASSHSTERCTRPAQRTLIAMICSLLC